MSRNGSGTYVPPTNSWNPAVNGVSATAVDWQSILNDLSSALTQSVSRDGQSAMTGNLPMSGNKLTGLGAGVATGDSVRWEQLFDQGAEIDVASAATTDIGIQNSNFIRITGTTTITSFGTTYRGPRFVRFGGVLTLTHNATTLILPSAANITTAAGDRAIITPIGNPASGWQVLAYERASGQALIGPDLSAYALLAGATFTGTVNAPNVNVTSLNTGPLAGNRNHIINGDFRFNQRVASSITDDTYGHDRWYALTQTGAIAVSTLTDVENTTPFMARLTQSQVTAQRMGYAQIIEGKNCKHLRGQQVTFRFGRTRLSTSANIRIAVLEWTGTEDSVTSDVVNDWTSATYTAGNFFIGTNLTVTNVTQQALTANTLTNGSSITVTLGSAFNNLIVFAWTEGAVAQNVTFDLSKAQLEFGGFATPFENRSFTTELELCQRYFCKTYEQATAPATVTNNGAVGGVSTSGSSSYVTWSYPVCMRVNPATVSLVFYNPNSGATGTWRDSGAANPTAVAGLAGDARVAVLTSTGSANALVFGHIVASAEL